MDQWVPYDKLVLDVLTPAQRASEHVKNVVKALLTRMSEATYDPKKDSFRFQPPYDISDKDELIMYLRRQGHAGGLDVKRLKQGWEEADEGITELEKKHQLIVSRNKRDGDKNPKKIWLDDPLLHASVDKEFQDMWFHINLPEGNKVGEELEAMQYRSAARVQAPLAVPKAQKKQRKQRTNVKRTNTHMMGMFKDYTNRRPNASK